MYAVSIRYPSKAGEAFDFRHWAEVHMPLGIATFQKVNGIMPVRVMVQHDTFGMDGTPASADSYATVWLIFDSEAGLRGFLRLHNDARASADVDRDVGNYAPLPPAIVLGRITVFEDMAAVLDRGSRLMRSG